MSYAKKYYKISGTEVSKIAIKIADEKYNIKLIQGEENLDLKEKFNVITIFHVLEHVHDPGGLIKRCYTLLEKEGVIIVAVPNDINKFLKLPLKRLLRFLRIGRFKYYGKFGMEKVDYKNNFGEIHLSQFTEPVLRKAFLDRGFRILNSSLDPYYVPNSLKARVTFKIFSVVKALTGKNFYDTILLIAQKN